MKIELSVVIPTLNEEESLKEILLSLALQKNVEMEIIVSDGGSEDSTCKVAQESKLRISLIREKRGRSIQLNAGAAAARGEFVLFLHADSGFNDRLALRMALDALCKASAGESGRLHAGHFALRFRRSRDNSRFVYGYLESKARLNRKGCSHGDQGILIPAKLFRRYGGFDESCQILSETRLADRLRENGEWMLLPAEITTSARRFEKEGMKERQILNAVIMILGAAGQEDLLALPGLYSPQDKGSKLQLQPLFRKIERKLSAMEKKERAAFWERVGGYLCENAWQITFRADVMIGFADTRKEGRNRCLEAYDRYLQRLVGNRMAAWLAGCASRLWLRYMAR